MMKKENMAAGRRNNLEQIMQRFLPGLSHPQKNLIMKIALCLVTIAFLLICSCQKHQDAASAVADSGCISRSVVKQTDSALPAAQLSGAKALFASNHLSFADLRFIGYATDTQMVTNVYVHIWADQYFKGLKIFNATLIYHFENGRYYFLSGSALTPIDTDTTPTLKLPTLRTLYLNELDKHHIDSKTYSNTCLDAQLGFMDLNPDSLSSRPVNLTRVWQVTPSGKSYPYAFFADQDSRTINFDDGIITF